MSKRIFVIQERVKQNLKGAGTSAPAVQLMPAADTSSDAQVLVFLHVYDWSLTGTVNVTARAEVAARDGDKFFITPGTTIGMISSPSTDKFRVFKVNVTDIGAFLRIKFEFDVSAGTSDYIEYEAIGSGSAP